MAETRIWLEDSTQSKIYSFGTTAASGEALVTLNKGIAAVSTVVLDVKGSQNIAGDLNLTGNLNITGAINEQSVTNLYVNDINILLNRGGTTAGATGSGILIEGDSAAVIGKLLYDSSLTSKWKIGDATTQVEVVTTSGAQTLTNKTITGSQISGNIAGNAANVTGTVAVANGGSGATTLTGYLKGTGTTPFTSSATIPGSDVSGNITGNAANVTGTVAVSNGGTGKGSTTSGALLLGAGTSAMTELVGGTTGYVVTWNGSAWTSAAPATSSAYPHYTTVSGTQDSTNKSFTLANTLTAGTEQIFLDGQLLTSGSSNDYVLSGSTLTIQAARNAPRAASTLKAYGYY